jgi:NAD(P) transhydrogenase subunit alpha
MKLDIITSLYVFMLAAFIGFEVIRRVSPLLHTPLMSLTNALDAIAVVGAIILAGEHKSNLAAILGTIAIVASCSPTACCACLNPAGRRDHNAH